MAGQTFEVQVAATPELRELVERAEQVTAKLDSADVETTFGLLVAAAGGDEDSFRLSLVTRSGKPVWRAECFWGLAGEGASPHGAMRVLALGLVDNLCQDLPELEALALSLEGR